MHTSGSPSSFSAARQKQCQRPKPVASLKQGKPHLCVSLQTLHRVPLLHSPIFSSDNSPRHHSHIARRALDGRRQPVANRMSNTVACPDCMTLPSSFSSSEFLASAVRSFPDDVPCALSRLENMNGFLTLLEALSP